MVESKATIRTFSTKKSNKRPPPPHQRQLVRFKWYACFKMLQACQKRDKNCWRKRLEVTYWRDWERVYTICGSVQMSLFLFSLLPLVAIDQLSPRQLLLYLIYGCYYYLLQYNCGVPCNVAGSEPINMYTQAHLFNV